MSSNTQARPASGPSSNHQSQHDRLKRDVTAFQSFAVAFGFVSIATGIFTAYGAMLSTSGPMGIWT